MISPLHGFSDVPRYWNCFNVTLPTVNAGTTGEVGVAASVHQSGGVGGPVTASTFLLAHPVVAGAGAVAFPAGLGFSHAYFNSSDGKIYFRFVNPTGSNYTAADIVTFQVVAL